MGRPVEQGYLKPNGIVSSCELWSYLMELCYKAMVLEIIHARVDPNESSSVPDMQNWRGLQQVPCDFAKSHGYRPHSTESEQFRFGQLASQIWKC